MNWQVVGPRQPQLPACARACASALGCSRPGADTRFCWRWRPVQCARAQVDQELPEQLKLNPIMLLCRTQRSQAESTHTPAHVNVSRLEPMALCAGCRQPEQWHTLVRAWVQSLQI